MTPEETNESSHHGVWRWFSNIEVVSGMPLAEVLVGADYTSNYATGLRLALWYHLILTKHVRQGPHLVEHVLLVALRPLEPREIVPAKMVLFPLLRDWEVEWEPPLSIFIFSASSSSSEPRSEMIWGNQTIIPMPYPLDVLSVFMIWEGDWPKVNQILMSNIR